MKKDAPFYGFIHNENTLYAVRTTYKPKDHLVEGHVFPFPKDGDEFDSLATAIARRANSHYEFPPNHPFLVDLVESPGLEGKLEQMTRTLQARHVTPNDQYGVPEHYEDVWTDDKNFNTWYWLTASKYLNE